MRRRHAGLIFAPMMIAWTLAWGCGSNFGAATAPGEEDGAASVDAFEAAASDGADASDASDASPAEDGAPPACDVAKPFGAPQKIMELDTAAAEAGSSLSPDELTLYFARAGAIYVATRSSFKAPFGGIAKVANINGTNGTTSNPHVTRDGSALYFYSNRGGTDSLYVALREPSGAFGAPTHVQQGGTDFVGFTPFVNATKTEAYFATAPIEGLGNAIGHATIVSPGEWSSLGPVAELTAYAGAGSPVLSTDDRTLYFASLVGAMGGLDIYVTTRPSETAEWAKPTLVPNVNSVEYEEPGWLSDDQCRLYMSRANDLYVATRPP